MRDPVLMRYMGWRTGKQSDVELLLVRRDSAEYAGRSRSSESSVGLVALGVAAVMLLDLVD